MVRAETLTRMLFDSDYQGLQTEHVKSALSGDPRLVLLEFQELQITPVAKLAAKYGLVSSNCTSTPRFILLPPIEKPSCA
jgi:tyrosyl-tRNA synthetase